MIFDSIFGCQCLKGLVDETRWYRRWVSVDASVSTATKWIGLDCLILGYQVIVRILEFSASSSLIKMRTDSSVILAVDIVILSQDDIVIQDAIICSFDVRNNEIILPLAVDIVSQDNIVGKMPSSVPSTSGTTKSS